MAHNASTFRYRVPHWRTDNQALIVRGGLTFWVDEFALAAWNYSPTNRRLGAPRIYSDTAIQDALVVKSVYGLSLRAAKPAAFVNYATTIRTLIILAGC